MKRTDGRAPQDLREVTFDIGWIDHHPGSVVVSFGATRVLVACTIEERVPGFRVNSGGGWLTASYAMLPAATHTRRPREGSRGQPDGRSIEIQRLVGRALRNAVNIDKLGQRTLHIDCDVLQADGGTRCASITGGWVAIRRCVENLLGEKRPKDLKSRNVEDIVVAQVAAVSMGVLDGSVVTDLCYEEDSAADTDLNLIGRSDGTIIEVQGTAEGAPMRRAELDQMIDGGVSAIERLCGLQTAALDKP